MLYTKNFGLQNFFRILHTESQMYVNKYIIHVCYNVTWQVSPKKFSYLCMQWHYPDYWQGQETLNITLKRQYSTRRYCFQQILVLDNYIEKIILLGLLFTSIQINFANMLLQLPFQLSTHPVYLHTLICICCDADNVTLTRNRSYDTWITL